VWTMSGGLLFDNFLITRDEAQAEAFAAASFSRKAAAEAAAARAAAAAAAAAARKAAAEAPGATWVDRAAYLLGACAGALGLEELGMRAGAGAGALLEASGAAGAWRGLKPNARRGFTLLFGAGALAILGVALVSCCCDGLSADQHPARRPNRRRQDPAAARAAAAAAAVAAAQADAPAFAPPQEAQGKGEEATPPAQAGEGQGAAREEREEQPAPLSAASAGDSAEAQAGTPGLRRRARHA